MQDKATKRREPQASQGRSKKPRKAQVTSGFVNMIKDASQGISGMFRPRHNGMPVNQVQARRVQ